MDGTGDSYEYQASLVSLVLICNQTDAHPRRPDTNSPDHQSRARGLWLSERILQIMESVRIEPSRTIPTKYPATVRV